MSEEKGVVYSKEYFLKERIKALEKDVKRHQTRLEEHRYEIDFNMTENGDLEARLDSLEKEFKILQQLIPMDWQQKENTKQIGEIKKRVETIEKMRLTYINEFRTNYKDLNRKLNKLIKEKE